MLILLPGKERSNISRAIEICATVRAVDDIMVRTITSTGTSEQPQSRGASMHSTSVGLVDYSNSLFSDESICCDLFNVVAGLFILNRQ